MSRAPLYVLAGIGTLTVLVVGLIAALSFYALRAEKRRYDRRPPRTRWGRWRDRRRRSRRIRAHRARLAKSQKACRSAGVPEPEWAAVVESLRQDRQVEP